mmetsp:Transcript_16044/g.27444  ORF Transcript_16044/g.27444 Transcript_16044/m.27444 type:complete len:217 (+) Transcript_16044:61-711(+)
MNFSLSFLFLFSILIVNVVGQCGPDDLCNGHGLCQGRNGCRCDFGWRGDVCNIKIEATTVAPGATATDSPGVLEVALLPTAIAAGAAVFCYLCSLILCCVMIRRGRNRKDPDYYDEATGDFVPAKTAMKRQIRKTISFATIPISPRNTIPDEEFDSVPSAPASLRAVQPNINPEDAKAVMDELSDDDEIEAFARAQLGVQSDTDSEDAFHIHPEKE